MNPEQITQPDPASSVTPTAEAVTPTNPPSPTKALSTETVTQAMVVVTTATEAKPAEVAKPAETPAPVASVPAPTASVATTETPAVTPTTETPPLAETKPSESPATEKKKVLIVEDTIELAEVLEATLQRMGIDTKHETHASKAIELFKTYKPNLVLLDIGLPDMSGWKMLDSIKESIKDNRPHFVIITAYGDPANRLMGKLQDVDSYLIKPFSPEEVERVVGKVLGLSKSA